MKRTKTYSLMAVLAGCLAATACIHQGELVEVPATLMHYQHRPTEAKLLAVAKTYAEAINRNLKQQAPYPGQYADYGVALARLGCTEQANVMFNNEKFLFPNSTLYVDMLKQTLTPSQSADNHIDTSMIDLHTLDTIHVTLTPEEEALQRQLEEDPAYKQKMKEQAKAERERQAELKRKAKAEQEKARKAQREAEKQVLKAERARQDSIARAERELKKQQKNTES